MGADSNTGGRILKMGAESRKCNKNKIFKLKFKRNTN